MGDPWVPAGALRKLWARLVVLIHRYFTAIRRRGSAETKF